MLDLIIDAAMAGALHEDALRMHPIPAWVITRDQVDYPGELVARYRLARSHPEHATAKTEVRSAISPRVIVPELGVAITTAAFFEKRQLSLLVRVVSSESSSA
jgi:hypothetical protein